ncbi:unnamed protein product, partial [Polarella glacialis]
VWLSYFPTLACDDVCTRMLTPAFAEVMPRLGPSGQQLMSSAVAGALAGLIVCAPTEGVVTRAHCEGRSVTEMLRLSLRQENGLQRLLMPYGQVAMVGREVPFSVGIFFLRDRFVSAFHGSSQGKGSSLRWWAEEASASAACATTVNLVSHPPSAILALQQGRDISLSSACKALYARGGLIGFYVGFTARTVSIAGSMFVVPTVMELGSSLLSRLPQPAAQVDSPGRTAQGRCSQDLGSRSSGDTPLSSRGLCTNVLSAE